MTTVVHCRSADQSQSLSHLLPGDLRSIRPRHTVDERCTFATLTQNTAIHLTTSSIHRHTGSHLDSPLYDPPLHGRPTHDDSGYTLRLYRELGDLAPHHVYFRKNRRFFCRCCGRRTRKGANHVHVHLDPTQGIHAAYAE